MKVKGFFFLNEILVLCSELGSNVVAVITTGLWFYLKRNRKLAD